MLSSAPSVSRHNLPHAAAELIAHQARTAILDEVLLTPKPGLVDRRNNGAHHDMNLALFMASTDAITPFFAQFAQIGWQHAHTPARNVLAYLRPPGIACEHAMFAATRGVNTHKGGIFALGLLCTAAGRLLGRNEMLTAEALCADVAHICHDMVRTELGNQRGAQTAGERLFQIYGLTGARGEAASGYATVRQWTLPVYLQLWQQGVAEETVLLQTLLQLMAHNPDTNLVSRGGLAALEYVQTAAQTLLQAGGALATDGRDKLMAFDDELIARHLSPGGSADLLAVTCFLARLPGQLQVGYSEIHRVFAPFPGGGAGGEGCTVYSYNRQ